MLPSKINAGEGFEYSSDPQGSPEWVQSRVGKVTASRLKDWLAVAKRPNKEGIHPPLKARSDYEKELAFEKQFNVPFSRFTTRAMEEGIIAEQFVKTEYEKQTGRPVIACGSFYNDHFVASPDGLVGDDGLIEVKWFYDTSFVDVLANGVPDEYQLQVQGQLWASGRKWCDFVVGSNNAQRFKVIRVERDEDIISQIADSVPEVAKVEINFDEAGLYEFSEDIQINNGEW